MPQDYAPCLQAAANTYHPRRQPSREAGAMRCVRKVGWSDGRMVGGSARQRLAGEEPGEVAEVAVVLLPREFPFFREESFDFTSEHMDSFRLSMFLMISLSVSRAWRFRSSASARWRSNAAAFGSIGAVLRKGWRLLSRSHVAPVPHPVPADHPVLRRVEVPEGDGIDGTAAFAAVGGQLVGGRRDEPSRVRTRRFYTRFSDDR